MTVEINTYQEVWADIKDLKKIPVINGTLKDSKVAQGKLNLRYFIEKKVVTE